MNRQQRRLAAKEARARAAIRTEKDYEEKTINDRISIIMIEQFYTAVGLALHDEFQFGQQRIARVWRRMNDLMFSIGEDVENYNRMVQELKDKCDLSISWLGVRMMREILNRIGLPALLEQTAEECSELAQACLKYARLLRQENPTPKTEQECVCALMEEIADVKLCESQLDTAGIYDYSFVLDTMADKLIRWQRRLKEQEGANND